jgi:hypothetical protein
VRTKGEERARWCEKPWPDDPDLGRVNALTIGDTLLGHSCQASWHGGRANVRQMQSGPSTVHPALKRFYGHDEMRET